MKYASHTTLETTGMAQTGPLSASPAIKRNGVSFKIKSERSNGDLHFANTQEKKIKNNAMLNHGKHTGRGEALLHATQNVE